MTSFALAYSIASYDSNGEQSLFSALYIFVMYEAVLLLFTFFSFNRIM